MLAGMDASWMVEARCRGAPLQLFVPDDEVARDGPGRPAPSPPPEVLAYCRPCPVRDRCLAWALAFEEQGYWGGTTTAQRRQLARPRRRLGCPLGCGPGGVVLLGLQLQVCVACGVSWPTRRAG